jgi:hypothetical protein
MKTTELEKFKERVYKEVLDEVQGNQGIPITFDGIELEEKTKDKFEGSLICCERSGRRWKVSLFAELHENEVVWNANDLGWYSFHL